MHEFHLQLSMMRTFQLTHPHSLPELPASAAAAGHVYRLHLGAHIQPAWMLLRVVFELLLLRHYLLTSLPA